MSHWEKVAVKDLTPFIATSVPVTLLKSMASKVNPTDCALGDAAKALGCELLVNAEARSYRSETFPYVIRLPGESYDVGLKVEDGKLTPYWDTYSHLGKNVIAVLGDGLKKLMQEAAAAHIVRQAKANGQTIERRMVGKKIVLVARG